MVVVLNVRSKGKNLLSQSETKEKQSQTSRIKFLILKTAGTFEPLLRPVIICSEIIVSKIYYKLNPS